MLILYWIFSFVLDILTLISLGCGNSKRMQICQIVIVIFWCIRSIVSIFVFPSEAFIHLIIMFEWLIFAIIAICNKKQIISK